MLNPGALSGRLLVNDGTIAGVDDPVLAAAKQEQEETNQVTGADPADTRLRSHN
jgi:hypothetical protein